MKNPLKKIPFAQWKERIQKRWDATFSERPTRIEFKDLEKKKPYVQWTLIGIGSFLLALIVTQTVSYWMKPERSKAPVVRHQLESPRAKEGNVHTVIRRNMFNSEGFIPEPFDQGLLDCFEQARPSMQRIQLLGTLVTSDDRFSVALIQEENNSARVAVRKDDFFSEGKFQVLKIDRKKFCFQVRATGDLEFIEIPEDQILARAGLSSSIDGIIPLGEREFNVKKSYLDEKLLDLNELLQTARAVGYTDPKTGKFMGFLVQTIEPTSPFAQLGVKAGDILTYVNNIQLDNPGKGIEAFQKLKSSSEIVLGVVRSGESTTIKYAVKK